MYGIFTYIWVIIGANVGKCTIHGAYGNTTRVRDTIQSHAGFRWMIQSNALLENAIASCLACPVVEETTLW